MTEVLERTGTEQAVTAPALNRPLIERIIQQLAKHPEQHNQDNWGEQTACRTTHCVAGWALHLTPGVELHWEWHSNWAELGAVTRDGVRQEIDQAAQEIMGLTGYQADDLFYSEDSAAGMIERLRALLASD